MGGLLAPVGYALFVWWFSTGVILLLQNLPRRTYAWSAAAGTVVFAVCLHRLAATASDMSETAAYAAFTYGVLAWGWHEMAFFMGIVTGPRNTPAPPGASTAQRFRLGLLASLWHELAILATAALIVWSTWGAPNQVGTWTFVLLWVMRTSAKLNVVLGVLNLGEEFIPAHLRWLLSFMARRPMNLLMPISLTLGTIGAALLTQAAMGATPPAQAGPAMLAAMMSLAVLEHWCLILPLPFGRLWAWFLSRKSGTRHNAATTPTLTQSPRGTGHGLPALLP